MAANPTDPFRRAKRLYDSKLDQASTREIRALLGQAANTATPEVEAKRLAYDSIVALCDYLNKWNGADKEVVNEAETQITTVLRNETHRADHNILALAHYAHGFIHRTRGEHRKALEAFSKSLELDPEYARAYAQKGAEMLYLGHPVEAEREVREALKRVKRDSPLYGMGHWIIARAKFFEKKYPEAVYNLEIFVAAWPEVPWYGPAYLVSAQALCDPPDKAAVERAKRDFLTRFPHYTVSRVIDNERTNPNDNPEFIEMRELMHEGLRKAGIPP